MAAEVEVYTGAAPSHLKMVSAFLAMEPPDVVISLARDFGGGSITENVQSCIWDHCISKADVKSQGPYLKRIVKKLILEIESSGGVVLDELYEQCAFYMITLKDEDAKYGNYKVLKTISFLYPNESAKLDVRLQCSVNMLEGDTGCSIWPSSLFLSEFILSFPEIFANKCCLEVGSGVGLVGVCLSHVKASKVILTDGDLSTLANMKINLELNNLSTENAVDLNKVHCVCLPWESASKDDLCSFAPDIILGADIIYDPSCLPHLVRVLRILLNFQRRPHEDFGTAEELRETKDELLLSHSPVEGPVAYIASVIRNVDTFNYFLTLAEQANLNITDISQTVQVSDFLPYLKSYQRHSIRLLKVHV